MKEIGENFTKKILFLIIFWLTMIIFYLNQTSALINHIKLSLKSLNLFSTLNAPLKKISKIKLKFNDKPCSLALFVMPVSIIPV